MNKFDLGWLVALLEGEGSIGLYLNKQRGRFQCYIRFTNTDEQIINKLVSILDGIKIEHWGRAIRYGNNHIGKRPVFEVAVQSLENCYILLSLVEKHLVSYKKTQAKILRKYLKRRIRIQRKHINYRNKKDKKYKISKIEINLAKEFKMARPKYEKLRKEKS